MNNGLLSNNSMMNPSMTNSLTFNNPMLNSQYNQMNPGMNSMQRSLTDKNLLLKPQTNMGKSIDDTFSIQDRRSLLNTPSGLSSLLEGTSQKTREVYLSNHSKDFNDIPRNLDLLDDPFERLNPFIKSMRMGNLTSSMIKPKKNVQVIVRRQISMDSKKKNDEFSNMPHEFFIKPKLDMKRESGEILCNQKNIIYITF